MPLLQSPTPAGPLPEVACPDCAEACRRHWWAGYRADCDGCTARAIARGLAAFNALSPAGNGQREPLRELITKAMQGDYTENRRAVWRWWQADHERTA